MMALATESQPRESYGRMLVELAEQDSSIVVMDADLSSSTQTKTFARVFPDRFFNVGLAEQNMMGIASGLAASGKTVFVSTFAVFATCRCFDQLRMAIGQPGLNVKVVATHGGITVGEDGSSHQAVEDLALACSLPSFNVVVPSDCEETAQVMRVAAVAKGPFYIRLPRSSVPAVSPEGYRFSLGRAASMRRGKDATIIANGIMVTRALEAAGSLAHQGIEAQVLNMATLKPLDEAAIISAARETGAIVSAEEHLEQGGLGARVAQVVAREAPARVLNVALRGYAKSGRADELLVKHGLTAKEIEKAVLSAVASKG